MSDSPIDSVTIVGGGAAGWIMGLVLTTRLNRNQRDRVKVTLIESPRIPIIGVGEGTVTGFSQLLRQLNIPERDFMLASDASFKCAGRFVGWNRDAEGKPITFLNPFMEGGYLDGVETIRHFLKFGGGGRSYLQCTQPTQEIVEQMRAPKKIGSKPYQSDVPYTYHLNAAAFSEQLAAIAKERGVEYLQDELQDVELGEDGDIAALQLEQRGRYPVKFVIDCTGFRGRILQQALQEPFIPANDCLLVDRAIPMPVPHEDPDHIPPCTTARAMEAGWMFEVPLFSRTGTGYIYSSQFISDDQAWDELKRQLGDRAPADAEPRVINMKIGRVRNTWVRNCIATGLSAGFLEPLEATAIFTIEMTARTFVSYFPERGVDPSAVKRFNQIMDRIYRQIQDFVVMMYVTSNRPEPFWLAARNDIRIPETLQDNLALWENYLPYVEDVHEQYLFTHWNYLFVMLGKGMLEGRDWPGLDTIGRKHWEEALAKTAQGFPKYVQGLPSHAAYLQSLREQTQNKPRQVFNYNMTYKP